MSADEIEVIHMTAVEWDQALTNSLNSLGLTWEELTAQAKTGDFESLKARQLWLMAGGQGPNQADLEAERLRADVRAAYAERDEMWERKAAALRELERIRRALADSYGEDYAGEDTAAEVKRLFRHLGEHDDNVQRILQRKNAAIEKAQAERDALKAAKQRVQSIAEQWVAQAAAADDGDELVPVLANVGRTILAALNTPTT